MPTIRPNTDGRETYCGLRRLLKANKVKGSVTSIFPYQIFPSSETQYFYYILFALNVFYLAPYVFLVMLERTSTKFH